MLQLHDLKPSNGARHKRKRVGRGIAAGQGKTAGRGIKGQNARSGGGVRPGFEGGQNPLYRRLPKRGFKNPNRVEYAIVNVSHLQLLAEKGITEITPEILKTHRLIRKLPKVGVKILGNGDLTSSLNVHAHHFSSTAKEKITSAGGKVVDLAAKISK